MRIVLDVNAATGDVTVVSTTEAPVTAKAETEITYPYHDPFLSHTFATKAEHDDYLRRVKERNQNIVDVGQQIMTSQAVLQPGAIIISSLDKEDLKFFSTFVMELYPDVGPISEVHRFNSWIDSGRMDDGTGHVPSVSGIPGTEGWTIDEHEKVRNGGWDWSTYRGVLVDRLQQRRRK